MNVSFLRGSKLRFQNKVDEVKEQTKKFIEHTKDDLVHRWEETSRDVISSFLRVFGGNGNDWNFYPRVMRALRSPSASPDASDNEQDDEEEEFENQDKNEASSSKASSSSATNGTKRKSENSDEGPSNPKVAKT